VALWLAVWCAFAVCVTFAPSAERKVLWWALWRSIWTWAGVVLVWSSVLGAKAAAGNSVGEGDGIESVILTQFLRVSGLVTPFAAGHSVVAWEVFPDPGEYPRH
jgi:hypothetical protein